MNIKIIKIFFAIVILLFISISVSADELEALQEETIEITGEGDFNEEDTTSVSIQRQQINKWRIFIPILFSLFLCILFIVKGIRNRK